VAIDRKVIPGLIYEKKRTAVSNFRKLERGEQFPNHVGPLNTYLWNERTKAAS